MLKHLLNSQFVVMTEPARHFQCGVEWDTESDLFLEELSQLLQISVMCIMFRKERKHRVVAD